MCTLSIGELSLGKLVLNFNVGEASADLISKVRQATGRYLTH